MSNLSRFFALGGFLWALLLGTPAHTQEDSTPLRVAIKPLEPFVNYEDDNTYTDFSIDLWRAIADELTLREGEEFVWVPLETVDEVLNAVRTEQADVGIAGISITREREEFVDFSQPMFNAGLQILTRVEQTGGLSFDGLQQLLSPEILAMLGALMLIGLVMGHVMWWAERNVNPALPASYREGIGEAIWWTMTSILAVSENHPRTSIGRLIGFVWMIVGIVLIAALTADITVTNTVEQLQGSIQGIDDLPGKRVVTVAGTTAEDYLRERDILFASVTAIDDAYDQLSENRTDAVVYDAPVLLYYSQREGDGRVRTVGGMFARQDYGIAVPSGSPLREDIDRALLTVIEAGRYTEIYDVWFGEQ